MTDSVAPPTMTTLSCFRCAANCMMQEEEYESCELFPLHLTNQFERPHCGHYLCLACLKSMCASVQEEEGASPGSRRVKCPLCSQPVKARSWDLHVRKYLMNFRRRRLPCGQEMLARDAELHEVQCVGCLNDILRRTQAKIQEMNAALYTKEESGGLDTVFRMMDE